jgi:shikimate dehydrogenase
MKSPRDPETGEVREGGQSPSRGVWGDGSPQERGDPGGSSPRGYTAAVLGSPIAHSLSPALHLGAYAALGLPGWTYTAIECDEARLPGLIASCDDRWAGLSLTMPLKRAVLPLLDRIEPLAAAVGGANTVVFVGGQRHGYNTDVPGMVVALAEAGVAAPAGATILGAGATACAALAALSETGLAAVVVQVRDRARAGGLLAAARRLGMAVELRPFGSEVRDGDLLISTVPAGVADFYAERAGGDGARPAAVLDVVYSPWPTPLVLAAAKWGAVVVGGFDLLLHQAARQVELMTGIEPAPLEAMRAAGQAELTRRAHLSTC